MTHLTKAQKIEKAANAYAEAKERYFSFREMFARSDDREVHYYAKILRVTYERKLEAYRRAVAA